MKAHHHSIPPSASAKRTSSAEFLGGTEHHQQPNAQKQQAQAQPPATISSGSSVPLYGNRVYKRQKTVEAAATQQTSCLFDKLNPDDPVHAQRMVARQKAIQKGKNTAGYDAYVQQVPKHQRRPRSMETPSTPDHTLDIPAKRWQGMVKAW